MVKFSKARGIMGVFEKWGYPKSWMISMGNPTCHVTIHRNAQIGPGLEFLDVNNTILDEVDIAAANSNRSRQKTKLEIE